MIYLYTTVYCTKHHRVTVDVYYNEHLDKNIEIVVREEEI